MFFFVGSFLIAGKMLDRFAMHVSDYNDDFTNFFNAIIWFLLASMGVALVSRIAKELTRLFCQRHCTTHRCRNV